MQNELYVELLEAEVKRLRSRVKNLEHELQEEKNRKDPFHKAQQEIARRMEKESLYPHQGIPQGLRPWDKDLDKLRNPSMSAQELANAKD